MSKCTATSKRTGKRCGAQAMRGREVCYHHGGKSPRGLDSPETRHGRYSKDLPTRMFARFAAGLEDADLTSLRSELALLDARLGELLSTLDSGEDGAIWQALTKAKAKLDTGTDAERKEALGTILHLIDRGAAEWMKWREVSELIETRRRVAATEHKRATDLEQMIEVRRLNVILGGIEKAIRARVPDAATRAALVGDFRAVITPALGGSLAIA